MPIETTTLDKLGRVVIPAGCRRELGLKPGDRLRVVIDDGEIRLLTMREVVRRIQEEFRQYVPKGRMLSEELLRERREEAARE